MKKYFTWIILPLVFTLNLTLAYAKEVIPGGESIGVVMTYDGILITGDYAFEVDGVTQNPNQNTFQQGDLIIQADNTPVKTNAELLAYIKSQLPNRTTIDLTIKRDNRTLIKPLQVYYEKQDDSFKTGLYVQDNVSGIGTITFYDPTTHAYGALGHPLDEKQTLNDGEAFNAYILAIEKSYNGAPGQKQAQIDRTERLGDVMINDVLGIYGHYTKIFKANDKTIETALPNEVELGKATMLTVIDGKQVEPFEIEITHLEKQVQSDVKGISFEVTDQRLLATTNGIVQGMSGAPIIQNGKLVGAVTHVRVDDVKAGYGIYIEWMLKESTKMIEGS